MTRCIVDTTVFQHTPSYCKTQVASIFYQHEIEKKHEYGDHIHAVGSESFAPLIFSAFGGVGKEDTIFTIAWLKIYYHISTTQISPDTLLNALFVVLFSSYVL